MRVDPACRNLNGIGPFGFGCFESFETFLGLESLEGSEGFDDGKGGEGFAVAAAVAVTFELLDFMTVTTR